MAVGIVFGLALITFLYIVYPELYNIFYEVTGMQSDLYHIAAIEILTILFANIIESLYVFVRYLFIIVYLESGIGLCIYCHLFSVPDLKYTLSYPILS